MPPPVRLVAACRILLCVAAILALALHPATLAAQQPPVDLELIIAVDVSASIDRDEARLQRVGFQSALANPLLIAAVKRGRYARIAVTYFEWDSFDSQTTVVDWRLIEDEAGAEIFVGMLEDAPPRSGSRTSISGAIDFAMKRFAESPYRGTRRVIDVSGDGVNNSGRALAEARAEALAAGVTINGLPILGDHSGLPSYTRPADLEQYFKAEVIGGPGAFVIVAENFRSYSTAILDKLIREISWLDVEMPDLTELAGN